MSVPSIGTPQPYYLLHLTGKPGIWRPIVGVLALVAWMLALSGTFALVPFVIYAVSTDRDLGDYLSRLVDLENPTPGGLAYLNIALASLIPAVLLVTWLLHGLKPRWLSSVGPRMRWRFFVVCIGLALVSLIAALVVGAVLPHDTADGAEVSGELNAWTSTTRDFALIVLLLTPFQAAGEEYLFRGYLTQAFGGIFRSRLVAIVVPAVLFALAHGLGQSVPIFFDRLAFGLVAGLLVVLTGGLEAGIAMHVLNNWVAFGLTLAFGDMATALNPTGGGWWMVPATLAQSLVFLGLVYAVARAMGLRNSGNPRVLEAPTGPV